MMSVYRQNFVANNIEQTIIKTEKFLKEHSGQTFVFDKPLVFGERDNFGKQALNTLNSLKTNYSVVVLFFKNGVLIDVGSYC